jgi:hypothetical protein
MTKWRQRAWNGHSAVRIVDADQLGDDLRGLSKALQIDGEMFELATQAGGKHLMRALAHSRG